MITLIACQNNKNDAKTVFAWRNDPKTVASSYIARPKTWDSFWLEYSECYFQYPALSPVFIADDGLPVGFMRFDKTDSDKEISNEVEIMINIAPDYRGQGIGTEALYLARQRMKSIGIAVLKADIRKTNRASVELFKKAGFTFLNERTEFISKTGENCRILCYVCIL